MKYSLLLFAAICLLTQTVNCQSLKRHEDISMIESTGDWRPYPISNKDEHFQQVVVYARRQFANKCSVFKGWKFEKVVWAQSQIVSGVQYSLKVKFSKNSQFIYGYIKVWQHPFNQVVGKFQYDITSCRLAS